MAGHDDSLFPQRIALRNPVARLGDNFGQDFCPTRDTRAVRDQIVAHLDREIGQSPRLAVAVERRVEQPPRIGLVIAGLDRSEEHTSELQSLMRTSYAAFCLT